MTFTAKMVRNLAIAALGLTVAAGTAQADRFTFRIGSGHPKGPAPYVTTMSDFFVAEVKRRAEEETEHKVTFIESYGGGIAGVSETLEAVQRGLLDFGGYCVCFEPSNLYLHNFPYFEPFGPQASSDAIAAVRVVYDKNPWLSEVFEEEFGQQLLGLGAWDNYHLGTKMAWTQVSDLKGVKIGGAGPNLPWLEYAGAVPVQSSLPEGYMAMKTGVYDGWLMTPAGYNGFKYYEPSPYYTLIGFGAMPVVVLTANQKKMASLPDDLRQIISEVGAQWEHRNGKAMDDSQAAGLAALRENGAIITELPNDVQAEWAQSLAEFPRKSARDANSRGMPGTKVMKDFIEAAKAGGHVWPVEYTFD
ncbi:Neu5Ac-binding protein [Thalassovita gelatinovora]|uniref:Neu5Ac-binding protein n=1 Tax=Thalassovita gelatinovora TaxID=53501 RepID=A0A0P1FJ92_THAGE|nr:C4-dicarboxylate TRAP transporter substrate-binding protein [Thalassovita gelatinovora]QIZ81603.1 TRAP transporter substrate-binding protein DctP [Thalassovita gelatinovora]CUH68051.1 Neu5Ac-binding protein [Thalassovita gelatinovora]SEQ28320.1 TRAP-type C4-dicarboxylate transport system, substrate-binding protein [Thalassovita gelatinovora]